MSSGVRAVWPCEARPSRHTGMPNAAAGIIKNGLTTGASAVPLVRLARSVGLGFIAGVSGVFHLAGFSKPGPGSSRPADKTAHIPQDHFLVPASCRQGLAVGRESHTQNGAGMRQGGALTPGPDIPQVHRRPLLRIAVGGCKKLASAREREGPDIASMRPEQGLDLLLHGIDYLYAAV